jgi:hypothetical protein
MGRSGATEPDDLANAVSAFLSAFFPRSAEMAAYGTEGAVYGTSGSRRTGEPRGGRQMGEPLRIPRS